MNFENPLYTPGEAIISPFGPNIDIIHRSSADERGDLYMLDAKTRNVAEMFFDLDKILNLNFKAHFTNHLYITHEPKEKNLTIIFNDESFDNYGHYYDMIKYVMDLIDIEKITYECIYKELKYMMHDLKYRETSMDRYLEIRTTKFDTIKANLNALFEITRGKPKEFKLSGSFRGSKLDPDYLLIEKINYAIIYVLFALDEPIKIKLTYFNKATDEFEQNKTLFFDSVLDSLPSRADVKWSASVDVGSRKHLMLGADSPTGLFELIDKQLKVKREYYEITVDITKP